MEQIPGRVPDDPSRRPRKSDDLRRFPGEAPLPIRALAYASPFVLAALLLPTPWFLVFVALAGIYYVVTSRKCRRCGKRAFQGFSPMLLGPLARCRRCGGPLGGRKRVSSPSA